MKTTFDPYDVEKKQQLHPKADQKNFIKERKGKLVLCCGARKKKKDGFCRSIAGAGTDHLGYGRCKFCGGNNKGPTTKAGLEKSSQNARKHGLYAQHLNEEEQGIYEEIKLKKDQTLTEEISFLRTKLTSYLRYVRELEQKLGKTGIIRFRYKGETRTQYGMGSIEDPHVHKTLEQIRRLMATSNSIDDKDEANLLLQINAELRAASLKEIKSAWGARSASGRPSEEMEQ
jgi:hypothetical protein